MNEKIDLFLTPPVNFVPAMHVASCYITSRGRLLLLQSSPHKPYGLSFSAPGGKLEPLETPLDAVLRETFEETGLSIDPKALHHKSTFFVRYPHLDFVYDVYSLHLEEPPEEITLNPREHIAYVWASSKEMLSLPLMPGAAQCFEYIYGKNLTFN